MKDHMALKTKSNDAENPRLNKFYFKYIKTKKQPF